MMINRIFLFVLLVIVGCDNDVDPCSDNLTASFEPCSSIKTVTTDQCILQEVQIRDGAGDLADKFVYYHDGKNYHQIDRYNSNDNFKPFPTEPTEIIQFTYYQNGLVSRIKTTSFEIPTSPSTLVRNYMYLNDKLIIRYEAVNPDGSISLSYENDEFYISSPKDSLYYYYAPVVGDYDFQSLFDFKDGNLIRRGRASKEGCELYNARWLFTKNYYDDLPNVLRNCAVRYPLAFGKIVYGTMSESYVEISANNIIGRIDKDGEEPYCWTLLKNPAQNYWIKEFSGARQASDRLVQYKVTYHYDCE